MHWGLKCKDICETVLDCILFQYKPFTKECSLNSDYDSWSWSYFHGEIITGQMVDFDKGALQWITTVIATYSTVNVISGIPEKPINRPIVMINFCWIVNLPSVWSFSLFSNSNKNPWTHFWLWFIYATV